MASFLTGEIENGGVKGAAGEGLARERPRCLPGHSLAGAGGLQQSSPKKWGVRGSPGEVSSPDSLAPPVRGAGVGMGRRSWRFRSVWSLPRKASSPSATVRIQPILQVELRDPARGRRYSQLMERLDGLRGKQEHGC